MAQQPAEVECVDCNKSKEEAQAKAVATPSDGLRLGECAPLYRKWADCVEEQAGQAKACAAVLDEFKLCHRRSAEPILASATLKK